MPFENFSAAQKQVDEKITTKTHEIADKENDIKAEETSQQKEGKEDRIAKHNEEKTELEKQKQKLEEIKAKLTEVEAALKGKYDALLTKITTAAGEGADAEAIKTNLTTALNQIIDSKTAQVAGAADMEIAALDAISANTMKLLEGFEGKDVKEGLEAIDFIMKNKEKFVSVLAKIETYGKGKWKDIHKELAQEMADDLDAELEKTTEGYKDKSPAEKITARQTLLEKKIMAFQTFVDLSMKDGYIGDQTSTAIFELLDIQDAKGKRLTMLHGEKTVERDEDTVKGIIEANKPKDGADAGSTDSSVDSGTKTKLETDGWSLDENGKITGNADGKAQRLPDGRLLITEDGKNRIIDADVVAAAEEGTGEINAEAGIDITPQEAFNLTEKGTLKGHGFFRDAEGKLRRQIPGWHTPNLGTYTIEDGNIIYKEKEGDKYWVLKDNGTETDFENGWKVMSAKE
ncbi:MAG: hypothetical protein WC269_03965, partial [Candidatus Gracilibacteria bacterium]